MLSRLADLLILRPTRNPVFAGGKRRRLLPFRGGNLVVWTESIGVDEGTSPELFVLNLPATGGRAERSGIQPFDSWPDLPGEIWSLNPPGYGASSGRASLASLAAAARCAFSHLQRVADGRPILIVANCVGSVSGLYLAAEEEAAGLIVRNPLPLQQTIVGRFNRLTLGVGAKAIANCIPPELDSLRNAARSQIPAVFVISGRDRVVPPVYQRQVFDAYGGDKQLLVLPDAGHDDSLKKRDRHTYAHKLNWLRWEMNAVREVGELLRSPCP